MFGEAQRQNEKQRFGRGERISDNILLCEDGKYRWIYEMSLLKNPTIFLLVWKILFFILLGIFAVITLADLIQWGADGLAQNLKFFGYMLIGITVLTALGYLLYAAVMGWKYCVLFEMDERGVTHKQMPRQAEKAALLAGLTALVGAASGSPGTTGLGLTAARTEMYTEFSKVKSVKAYPKRHVLKLNETLEHNQVYAETEDYEFVKSFILANCTKLKRK